MDRASNTDICKRTIAGVDEADIVIVAPQEEVMNSQVPKYVTQARASFLLGIPEAEFRRMARESGLGHVERAGNEEETYFTYEELQRICKLAAHQMQAVH
jgi:cellobiose-specific phosphotransferase system component IIB